MKNPLKLAASSIICCLSIPLVFASSAAAADRSTFTLQIQTESGPGQRVATTEFRDGDGFVNPCGATLKYGGMADDGVRVLNCDGTGSYIDGTRTGGLKWGYALSAGDQSKLTVKSFDQWQVDQISGDSLAALIYIEFTSGELKGRGVAEVLGMRNGFVAMSPYYFGNK